VLALLVAIFAAGSMLVVAINGGGHTGVLLLSFAAIGGNALVEMVLVMILTVYLNNIKSAGSSSHSRALLPSSTSCTR
jgi:hypothetical protein